MLSTTGDSAWVLKSVFMARSSALIGRTVVRVRSFG